MHVACFDGFPYDKSCNPNIIQSDPPFIFQPDSLLRVHNTIEFLDLCCSTKSKVELEENAARVNREPLFDKEGSKLVSFKYSYTQRTTERLYSTVVISYFYSMQILR